MAEIAWHKGDGDETNTTVATCAIWTKAYRNPQVEASIVPSNQYRWSINNIPLHFFEI